MQFKALDAKRATQQFEDYKRMKLQVIRKGLLGEDYSGDREALREAWRKLNELSLDADMMRYVQNGDRESPYVWEFESRFVKSLVSLLGEGSGIDINKLKVVYQN